MVERCTAMDGTWGMKKEFYPISLQFARKARLGGYETGQYARGIGTNARPIRVSRFSEFKVGDFTIKNAAVTITELDADLLGGDGNSSAGLLGAEYLGLHGAVFDFNSGTLYLRPQRKS